MIDMGDLREGIWFSEYQKILDTINLIKTLPCLDLYGLGTNFNCYGTVLPTVKNGEDFLALASRLERDSGLTIRRLSAGNCTSYHLLDKGIWPKGLNHLRIGGLHEFGIEYVEMKYLNEFHHSAKPVEKACSDMYVLEAEIIELNSKPTVPVGELGWMHSCRVKPLPITASVSVHYWHLVARMSRLITVCHVMTVSPFWGRPAIIPWWILRIAHYHCRWVM
jgi:predicted amino acid racemase